MIALSATCESHTKIYVLNARETILNWNIWKSLNEYTWDLMTNDILYSSNDIFPYSGDVSAFGGT